MIPGRIGQIVRELSARWQRFDPAYLRSRQSQRSNGFAGDFWSLESSNFRVE
jgi:hypothetical protein